MSQHIEIPDFRATSSHSYRSASTFLSLSPAPTPEPHGLSPRPSFSRNLSIAPGGLPYDENTSTQYGRQQLKVEPSGPQMYTPNRARTLSTVSAVSNATWWSAVASIQTQDGITEVTPAVPDHNQTNVSDEIQPAKKTDSGFSSCSGEDDRYRPDSGGVESLVSNSSSRPRTRCSRQQSSREGDDRPQSNTSRNSGGGAKPRLSRQCTTTWPATATTNSKSRSRRPSTSHVGRVPCHINTAGHSSPPISISPTHSYEPRPSSSATILRSVPPSSSSDRPWDWEWTSVHTNSVHRMPRRGSAADSRKYTTAERLRSGSAYTRSSDTLFQTASHSPRPRNVSLTGTASTATTAIPPDAAEDPTQPQTIAWKNLDSLRAEYAAADRRSKSPWGWIRKRILCGAGLLGCGGGQAEFWEEGDDDRGSVRRYRLALPSEGNVGEVVRMVGDDRVEKASSVGWVRGVSVEKEKDG